MIWMQAIRPKTLIASLSPILMGSLIAFSEGPFHIWIFFCTLLTGLGIQILANLANDYFDCKKGADTNARLGPTRVMQAGLVSEGSMLRALFFTSLATAFFGSFLIYLGGWVFFLLLLAAISLAFLYTAGPYPLAYLGLGDFFVLIFFGPVATLCVTYLQIHAVSMTSFFLGICPGALSTVILTCNNLRDVHEDRAANKQTLVVRFGPAFGKGEILICLLLMLLVPLILSQSRPLLLFVTLGMAWPTIKFFKELFGVKERSQYNLLLEKAAKLLLLFTSLFLICWLASHSLHTR